MDDFYDNDDDPRPFTRFIPAIVIGFIMWVVIVYLYLVFA